KQGGRGSTEICALLAAVMTVVSVPYRIQRLVHVGRQLHDLVLCQRQRNLLIAHRVADIESERRLTGCRRGDIEGESEAKAAHLAHLRCCAGSKLSRGSGPGADRVGGEVRGRDGGGAGAATSYEAHAAVQGLGGEEQI